MSEQIPHPKKFGLNGMFFQVTARVRLTDEQAEKIVRFYVRNRKFRKKDAGKLFVIHTLHDEDSLGSL